MCGELITLFRNLHLPPITAFHGAGTVMATKSISENKMSLFFCISSIMTQETCFSFLT